MPGDPRGGRKVWKVPNRKISKSGTNCRQVVVNGESHPSAAFHDQENRATLGPALDDHSIVKSRAPLDLGIANTFVQWTQSLASGLIVNRQFPSDLF